MAKISFLVSLLNLRSASREALFLASLALILVCLSTQSALAQAACVSPDDVKKMLAQIEAPRTAQFNKKLRDKLLKLREQEQKQLQETVADTGKREVMEKRIRASREQNTAQLCPIFKEFGWPTSDLVGNEGVAAAFLLLTNSSSFQLQKDLLPVIVAAARKREILRSDFAGYFDKLRLSSGLKQLFGTQATISNGFLVLYPIADEAQVDARRKQYDLEPLNIYIKALQNIYRLPLVKATGALANSYEEQPNGANAKKDAANLFPGQPGAEEEIIRINTNLVSLNVSVYSEKLKAHVSTLEQKDFTVNEDGHAESISFFARTDVPFDLVLLIDLSGSTSGKRDLIRQTTQRFIEAARPSDRLAIVTFSTTTNIVSPLTEDRKQLLESIAKIDGTGGSNVWDALKFTLDKVVGPKPPDRRRAVVFMTDGADNALMGSRDAGSEISFADLLEAVRRNDTLVIPIYLDTERDQASPLWVKALYENARKTLARLAEESGGLFYRARKIEDLNGVYAQVIDDLGKVYSLGYKPTNDKRDGSWRNVQIKIPDRPDLMTRARPGYYAN